MDQSDARLERGLGISVRSSSRARLLSVLLCSLSILRSSAAYASPALYTLGALDQGLPFSGGAWGGSSSVVSSNPAGLAWVPAGQRRGVGFSWVQQRLTLSYQARPDGVDVPESVYQARPARPEEATDLKPLPTSALRSRSAQEGADQQLLLQLNWSTALLHHLYVGVTSLIPLHRFELQSPSFVDERAQYFGNQLAFERWGDTLEGLSTAVGLAYLLGEQLSLGLGVNLSTRSQAQSDVFLGDVNYDGVSYISPKVEVNTALAPFASVELRTPLAEGQLGFHLSAHAEERAEVSGAGQVQVWGFPYPKGKSSIPQRFKQVYRQLPLRAHAGLSWREASGLGLTMGVGWAQWSAYQNRAGEAAEWSDQWDANLGLTDRFGDLSVGLDLRWRPSPVPEQIGRTSYVDPDQIAAAISGLYTLSKSVTLQLQAQGHRLLLRRDTKDERALNPVLDELPDSIDPQTGDALDASRGLQTNNPGFPGYQSEGWVWALHLGVRVAL